MEKKCDKKFSITNRLQSFKYAFDGLKILFKEEHNARIHLVVTIVVCILGFWLDISAIEWIAICILIGLVFCLEIINSAIENICDYISPDWHNKIKIIKDLAAAAVFVTALIAVICGCIIFIPKLYTCLLG